MKEFMKKAQYLPLHSLSLLTIALCGFTLPSTYAETPAITASVTDALKQSTVNLQFRYRLENVDQDNTLENATASTLRSRLTLNTGSWLSTTALFEVDHVTNIGAENYNSTVNGQTQHSVIADPTGTDINQAALLVSPWQGGQMTLGRQRVNLHNQRFIGSVGWRQNEQTFDGVRFTQQLQPNWQLDIASFHNANRVFGPNGSAADLHGRFSLASLNWQLLPNQQISAFHYDFDFEPLQSRGLTGRNSLTQGLDYSGNLTALPAMKWQLAIAKQQDAHQAPINFQHQYHRIDVSYAFKNFTAKLLQERLAGDGSSAFQTPFATLHAFQGFADLFLTTPNSGLRDHAIEVSVPVQTVKIGASWHRYDSDAGHQRLGTELNLTAAYDVQPQLNLLLKVACYQADSFAVDTHKVWLMASYSL